MITAANMTGKCSECGCPIAAWNKSGHCSKCREYSSSYDGIKQARWRQRNYKVITIRNCRRTADKEGLPFNLTADNLPEKPENCQSCNIRMIRGGPWRTQPSLDKKIPSLGYVVSNVAWICRRCNQVKGNASLAELQLIINYLETK